MLQTMPYTMKHVPSAGIAEINLEGSVTATELSALTVDCVELQRRTSVTGFLVIVDRTEINVPHAHLQDAPQRHFREVELRRSTRIAVLRPSTSSGQKAAEVYEAGCRKAGWKVQLFPDRKSAIDWLQG